MARPENRVLVYDVGGSHISAAVFDRDGCTVQGVVTEGHPSEQSIDSFFNVLHSLGTRAAQGQADIQGVSIAMPGPFDYERGVSWMQHKLPYLYGFDLRKALTERFGVPEFRVRFLNDAAAYLLGEIAAGSARGGDRVVGITLGTGIGSAFAVGGHVIREGTGVPSGGEIWNFPYQGGILEDQISTRAIRQSYQLRTGEDRAGMYSAIYAFLCKSLITVAGACGIALVGWFGFDATASQQSAWGAIGIKLVTVGLPALGFAASAPLIWWFPIDRARQRQIREAMRALEVAGAGSPPLNPADAQRDVAQA